MKATATLKLARVVLFATLSCTLRFALGAVDERSNLWRSNTHALVSTTPAYRAAATKELLKEVNDIAVDLRLPELFPITEMTCQEIHISPPSLSDQEGLFGTVITSNFIYAANCDNKLSQIDWNRSSVEPYFRSLEANHLVGRDKLNTNSAYQLATNWLSRARVDVQGLERDCHVHYHVMARGSSFLPVFWVMWRQSKASLTEAPSLRDDGLQTRAAVWLVEPERKLLQLGTDEHYSLRTPLTLSDRDALMARTDDILIKRQWYTTDAYKKAALDKILHASQETARRLQLPEKFPFDSALLQKVTIGTPSASDELGFFGTIRTHEFVYSAAASNKLSWIQRNISLPDEAHWLAGAKERYMKPCPELDTNSAVAVAEATLEGMGADIGWLRREQRSAVAWVVGQNFVPIYTVTWWHVEKGRCGDEIASVRCLAPTRALVFARVSDGRYLTNAPLQVANRQELLR